MRYAGWDTILYANRASWKSVPIWPPVTTIAVYTHWPTFTRGYWKIIKKPNGLFMGELCEIVIHRLGSNLEVEWARLLDRVDGQALSASVDTPKKVAECLKQADLVVELSISASRDWYIPTEAFKGWAIEP